MDANDGGLAEIGKQIERLTKAAVQADYPRMVDVGGAAGLYHYFTADGKLERFDPGPDWTNVRLETPQQLSHWIAEKGGSESAAVFVGRSSIVYALDVDDPRKRVFVPLVYTDAFEMLAKNMVNDCTQDQFVMLLRTKFAGCTPPGFDKIFRSVKYGVNEAGERVIISGRDAYGLSTNAKVELSGGVEPPEEVTLAVRVHKQDPFVAMIPCAVDANPRTQKFAMIPTGSAIEDALNNAAEHLAVELTLKDGPAVFIGSPNQ